MLYILLVIAGVVLFLTYGYHVVRRYKEAQILKSPLYAKAVSDWDKIQDWMVHEYKGDFKPISLMIVTNSFCGFDISVTRGEDGRLVVTDKLEPSEFVVMVKLVKKQLGIEI